MSTQRDLVGFQRRLVERLDAASARRAEPTQLALDSGGDGWLVELSEAREVIPVPALTRVPGTRHWFRGVTGIRGELIAVVDFAAYRGLEPTALQPESRMLVPHARFGVNAALLFARSLGLKATRTLEPGPEPGTWRDAVGRRWRPLLLGELLGEPRFLDIAA